MWQFSEDFRPLSEDFQRFSKIAPEGQTNVSKHFPKIAERLQKIAEDDRRRPEDVSIIHQYI